MSASQAAPVLVTGAAGFIGFHAAQRLLDRGFAVLGLDNLNDYYDARLKQSRLERLQERPGFSFVRLDLCDRGGMEELFEKRGFRRVVHLAAQAGVRHSFRRPEAYIESNVAGFLNVLEGCRRAGVEHLLFASSSSVYGANSRLPFSVRDQVDHPLSMYAATKKAGELMAHCYAHLHGLPCTGLRFFTVYGPWGRPDMAAFIFTKAILEGRPIEVYNRGALKRDFTYIDDVAEGVARALEVIPAARAPGPEAYAHPGVSAAPYRLYNLGNQQPVELSRFIEILEELLGRRAERKLMPMQPGDVPATYADSEDFAQLTGFAPRTPLEEGLRRFVAWYREYYKV